MIITYKGKSIDISIFDLVFTNYSGKQEIFTDADINYNLGVFGSGNSIAIKTTNKSINIAETHVHIQEQVRKILDEASTELRVAMTNKSVAGRLGNTAVPWYSAYGKTKNPALTMLIGVHILNPDTPKIINLPDNCKFIQAVWDKEFAPIDTNKCSVEDKGNQIIVNCKKITEISNLDFARLVPLYLEFEFDITDKPAITDFGPAYVPCEIPEIFGAYWRKKV